MSLAEASLVMQYKKLHHFIKLVPHIVMKVLSGVMDDGPAMVNRYKELSRARSA